MTNSNNISDKGNLKPSNSGELEMPPISNSEELFSKKTCRELSELLERSWQTIRNGQSDLRPIESQIKGIFKKEIKRALATHTTLLLEEAVEAGPKDLPKNSMNLNTAWESGYNTANASWRTALTNLAKEKGKPV